MFLQLDGTFWIQLANFAIFFVLLNVLFLRPVSKAIRTRRAYINSVTEDYDRYQAEAKHLREEAENVRAQARRDAELRLAKARAEASNVAAQLAGDYTQRSQARIEEARHTVATELQSARANEEQLAKQLAEVMVDRAVTEATR
jgi:F0F1-type ATP synthase membrane subunit b/b'